MSAECECAEVARDFHLGLQASGVLVRQAGAQFRSHDNGRNDQALRGDMFLRHNLLARWRGVPPTVTIVCQNIIGKYQKLLKIKRPYM